METVFTATDTPVRVNGFWRGEASNGLRADITGTGGGHRALSDIDADVRITVGHRQQYLHVPHHEKRRIPAVQPPSRFTASPATVTLAKLVTLSLGDYVELWG